MFPLLYGYHVGGHLDRYQHGVSMQRFINLGNNFPNYARINNRTDQKSWRVHISIIFHILASWLNLLNWCQPTSHKKMFAGHNGYRLKDLAVRLWGSAIVGQFCIVENKHINVFLLIFHCPPKIFIISRPNTSNNLSICLLCNLRL